MAHHLPPSTAELRTWKNAFGCEMSLLPAEQVWVGKCLLSAVICRFCQTASMSHCSALLLSLCPVCLPVWCILGQKETIFYTTCALLGLIFKHSGNVPFNRFTWWRFRPSPAEGHTELPEKFMDVWVQLFVLCCWWTCKCTQKNYNKCVVFE